MGLSMGHRSAHLSDGYEGSEGQMPMAITLVGFGLLAALSGVVISLGSTQLTMLLVGVLVAPVVIALRSTWLVVLLLLVSLIVTGCLQYFGRITQAHWLPTLLSLAMLLRVPFDAWALHSRTGGGRLGLSTLGLLLAVFVLLVVTSAVLNSVPVTQGLVGLRHYVFPLALTGMVALSRVDQNFWPKVWRWIPWLLLIQLPICLYQYFFVASARSQAFVSSGIAWDAVVGTFGGDPDGGGASGALALYICFGIVTVAALRKADLISFRLACFSCIAAIGVMLLAEIKVVAVFLPVAFLVLWRERVFRSPTTAVAWLIGSTAFIVTVLMAYSLIFWKGSATRSMDLEENINYVLKAESDPRFYNRLTGEVSRYGAVLLWYEENGRVSNAAHMLFGHGPAGSKISSLFGKGTAAKHHPFQLTTSTLSTLLWDLGLVGTFVFISVCIVALWKAHALAIRFRVLSPSLAAVMDSAAVAIGLVAIGIPYNADALNNPAIQTMLALAFGLILLFGRLDARGPLLTRDPKERVAADFRPKS